ncbi:MAG: type III-B CRISPR module-associated protein Cmr5 [Ktedonobacteraceae bacterium]
MITRDQKFAVDAYEKVSKVAEHKKDERDSYGSMAHKLPILIHTAGLAQALEFVSSRGKPAQTQLIKDIAETIGIKGLLPERARAAELREYMYLTEQVMAALLWYKRFAQSVLGVDTSIEEDKNEYTSQ